MMTTTKDISIAALAAAALLLPVGGARAAAYVKHGVGGDLLTNAYVTLGSGPLTEIDGTFSTSSATSTQGVPDLFAITLTAGTDFSATTVYTDTAFNATYDTQLYLFNSSGYGVAYNDDDPIQVLPGGIQVGAGATLPADSLPAGLYYLGISPEGAAPQSAGGNIFPNPLADGVSYTNVYGPTGVGGSKPLSKWSITGDDVESGSYVIDLTGASFGAVPESPAVALIGLGLLPLALVARRRVAAGKTSKASERTHA